MIRPLRSRVLTRRLSGDALAEHCRSLGLGAADLLVPGRRDPVWATVVEASPQRLHCPGASREHLQGLLQPGTVVLLAPGAEVMSLGGVSLVESCAIAARIVEGMLVGHGDYIVGEPCDEAAAALLSTSLALPEFVKTRGVLLSSDDAGSLAAELFSVVPLRCVSAGRGVAQDYRRDVTAPYTPDWSEAVPAGSLYVTTATGHFRVYRTGDLPLLVGLGRGLLGGLIP